jgi:hypothetical protein
MELYEEEEEEEVGGRKCLYYFMTLYQAWRLYTVRFHAKVITDFEWIRILEVVIMAYI